ncbi:LysR family transcriptional regulator [Bacillus carboniphilus]|uniref:LysR family transcriptional regulator n=1 Tax=Bacillus carboniphilus TaxID=86663 RepID=A0ABY9JSB7_9BACI|nr:LysR family transcriptional regulator [Bacillus carboniphilus]WLR41267.1 LysR family transcriptional regulator [Bacillus carboniphilus]
MLDIEQMKTFLAVAQTHHFTKAAKELGVTQSTVTSRIKQIESIYGTSLFSRNNRKVELTTAGQSVVPIFQRTLQLLEQSISTIQNRNRYLQKLSISCIDPIWTNNFITMVRDFSSHYPEISFSYKSLSNTDSLHTLTDGISDICLTSRPIYHSDIKCEKVIEDQYTLFAHQDSRKVKTISPNLFKKSLFIEYPWDETFNQWFKKHVSYQVADLKIESYPLLIKLMKQEKTFYSVSLKSTIMQEDDFTPIKLTMKEPFPNQSIFIAYKKSHPLSTCLNELHQKIEIFYQTIIKSNLMDNEAPPLPWQQPLELNKML